MRRLTTILTLFTISTSLATGQTFGLTDTTFSQGDIFTTRNIIWDYDKATLRPECFAFLDSLTDFLKENKGLVIEVGNHRDNRHDAGYEYMSTQITQNRAESIVDYLVNKGISANRLSAKGYGESKILISDNEIEKLKTTEEQEAAHATNRRTEFTILRTDYEN